MHCCTIRHNGLSISSYLGACCPVLGAHPSLLLQLLRWELHQLVGFDLVSAEGAACLFLAAHAKSTSSELSTAAPAAAGRRCHSPKRAGRQYLLRADDLRDAGAAVNVRAVRDDGESDRVQANRALLVGAAGQHQPQLLDQSLP